MRRGGTYDEYKKYIENALYGNENGLHGDLENVLNGLDFNAGEWAYLEDYYGLK